MAVYQSYCFNCILYSAKQIWGYNKYKQVIKTFTFKANMHKALVRQLVPSVGWH